MDLDGDGDLDLVIGTRTSGVNVVTNVGTRTVPRWADEGKPLLTAGGKKILSSNAHHADWDGDGATDLVLGNEFGEVAWYRNIGGDATPSYGERQVLIPQAPFEEIPEGTEPKRPGMRVKVFVTDYDGDGKQDLLVGDVQWHKKTLPPLTAEQAAAKAALEPEYEAARAAYRKALDERNASARKPDGIPPDVEARFRAANERMRPLRVQMAKFDREKLVTHGYVWLYRRR